MKILIVHEIDWIKKVPYEPHHLAELFSIQGHDVFVVDCAESQISKIKKGLSTSIIQKYSRLYDDACITLIRPRSILFKGLNRLTHFLSCKKIIKKIIVDNEIDIIFLYGIATNGIQCIQLSKELNIPLIFRILDVAHELVTIPMMGNIIKKHEKFIIKNAQKILTTTPELVKYAQEMGCSPQKISYFPLGINSTYFKPLPKSKHLIQKLGINNSDKVIGFIGTIFPFTGLDFLLKNFHHLTDYFDGIKFVIIGGGPDFNRIKKLIKKYNLDSNVMLTGFVKQDELSEYLSIFDLCVNPFVINKITDRIMPTKILEYMACCKPVLSTPLKGTVELLPDERNGIVYSSLNDFVYSIKNLISDENKLNELAKNGFSYVEKYHNWDSLVIDLLSIFNETIKNKKF